VALASHSAGRSVVIWLAIIHPITVCLVLASSWVAGMTWALVFVVVPYALHGIIFYTFSQLSHVQESCFAPEMVEMVEMTEMAEMAEKHPRLLAEMRSEMAEHEHEHEHEREHERELGHLGHLGHLAQHSQHSQHSRVCLGQAIRAQERQHGRAPPAAPKREWACHQVEHSLDYAAGSRLWLHLSNGLNLQVEHHLFPQVGWGHYRALAPIVRATCAEYGVVYTHQPTFWAALKAHLAHLQRLNSGELAGAWAPPPLARAQNKTL